jgi:hypothetical protein
MTRDPIAGKSEGYSGRTSATIRTARSRAPADSSFHVPLLNLPLTRWGLQELRGSSLCAKQEDGYRGQSRASRRNRLDVPATAVVGGHQDLPFPANNDCPLSTTSSPVVGSVGRTAKAASRSRQSFQSRGECCLRLSVIHSDPSQSPCLQLAWHTREPGDLGQRALGDSLV